jgi:hypothetical protein
MTWPCCRQCPLRAVRAHPPRSVERWRRTARASMWGWMTRILTSASSGSAPRSCSTTIHDRDPAVKRLVELGADLYLQDGFGRSAAHLACANASTSCLAVLLDAGVPPNLRNHDGGTLLMTAAEWDSPDCVALLLARGGGMLELDATEPRYEHTALHWAASSTRWGWRAGTTARGC